MSLGAAQNSGGLYRVTGTIPWWMAATSDYRVAPIYLEPDGRLFVVAMTAAKDSFVYCSTDGGRSRYHQDCHG